MIKSSHNPLVVGFFNWYIEKILRDDFYKINFDENFQFDPNKSILFIGNHFSWWDGFFVLHLCIHLFKKKFNVMMLEEELKKRIIFSYAGVYSVKRKSDTVNESLDYTCQLLSKPDNVVLMFPQGKIESMHKDKITFEKGLVYILENSKNFQLVYSAVFTDYFSRRKPVANIYLKNVEMDFDLSLQRLEEEYQLHYNKAKSIQNSLSK